MTPELFAFGGGVILLVLAALGGGIEVKEIKVPPLTPISRGFSAVGGALLLAVGLFLTVKPALTANQGTASTAAASAAGAPQPPSTNETSNSTTAPNTAPTTVSAPETSKSTKADGPAPAVAALEPSPSAAPSEAAQPAEAKQPLAVAPSFDCSKATLGAEKIICSTADLAVLDLALSNAFREVLARAPKQTAGIRDAQVRWLQTNRDKCTDAACLRDAYEARIREITRSSVSFLSAATAAQSIDCSTAKTDVEKLICATPALRTLDSELGGLYLAALKAAASPGSVVQGQFAMGKLRERCLQEPETIQVACVAEVYRSRIAVLRKEVPDAPAAAPDQPAAHPAPSRQKKTNWTSPDKDTASRAGLLLKIKKANQKLEQLAPSHG